MSTYVIIICGIIVAVLYGITSYNSLIKARNKVKANMAQIDVVLKRRNDLIPNLVECVKGYIKYESETLEKVINSRNSALNAADLNNINDKLISQKSIDHELNNLLALAENYPDLKANTNFIELCNELSKSEDKISYARTFYNDAVYSYMNKCESFPSSIIAKVFNFKSYEMIKISEEEKDNIKVRF